MQQSNIQIISGAFPATRSFPAGCGRVGARLLSMTGPNGAAADAATHLLRTAGDVHMMLTQLDAHYRMVLRPMLERHVVPFLGAGVNLCGRPHD